MAKQTGKLFIVFIFNSPAEFVSCLKSRNNGSIEIDVNHERGAYLFVCAVKEGPKKTVQKLKQTYDPKSFFCRATFDYAEGCVKTSHFYKKKIERNFI